MKEIFDRNQDRMTDDEDRRVWGALFDATRKPQPAWKRWRVAAPALATVAAAVVVVALVNRGPSDLARERVLADRAEITKQAGGESAESAAPPGPAEAQAPATDADAAVREDRVAEETASGSGELQRYSADPSTFEVGTSYETVPPGPGKDSEALSNEARVEALAESRRPEPTQAAIERITDAKGDLLQRERPPGGELYSRKVDDVVFDAVPQESAPPPAPERRAQVEMEIGRGFITGQVTSTAGDSLAFANVVLLDTGMGAATDRQGRFTIPEVPPGTYTLKVSYLGYEPVERQVEVIAGKELALGFELVENSLAQLEPVVIEAQKEMIRRTESSAAHRVSEGELDRLPVDTFAEAVGLKSGVVASGRQDTHYDGDRAEKIESQLRAEEASGSKLSDQSGEGGRPKPLTRALGSEEKRQMPFVPPEPGRPVPGGDWPISVGGTDPVNGQAFDAMFFEHYGVNPFVDPQDDRFATFAMDVDNASFAMARSYLSRGELPPKEAVRVEEFVNAFDHGYAPPDNLRAERRPRFGESEHGTFAIHLDAAPSPFGDGLVLMRVGLKGREIDVRDRKPAVLTFVIDVSGSMAREDRLELVKRALYLLLDQMNDEDEVGLVVYGSTARTILPHTPLRYRRDIERAIASLVPEGATNAEDGLRQGYALADRGFRHDHINRVILCSDGVANVGRTGADGILDVIKREAGRGIEMTAVGFGMGNYNDVLMEKLADQGDGNYYYVDDIAEARRVFVENLTGTLQTIARQCKIQVEFDPETVRRYRLVGYENRDVADRDFRNDAEDAGEVGAGHEVTALFEVKLEKDRRSDDLATVRIRYEDPESGRVTEEARTLRRSDVARRLDDTDATFRMDAAVVEFAEILRHSYWAKGSDLAEVVGLAKSAARDLGPREDVDEILGMAETAWRLWPRDQVPDRRDDIRPAWEPDDDHPQQKQ